MKQPQTRYARRGELSIAYQVVGSSGPWLVYVPGFMSHLDLQWTDLGFSRFLSRLASFTRLVLFDKPGTGLSDPIPHVPTLEERIGDVRCVLDAAGCDRAALLGFSEGGLTCALFAATWPERTSELIVYGSYATGHPSKETLEEAGVRLKEYEHVVAAFDDVVTHWGEGRLGNVLAPSVRGELRKGFWALYERAGASPAMARALIEAAKQADVSEVLPTIRVPTLVLHRTGDIFPIAGGRYFAKRVSGARFIELPGDDHAFWAGDYDAVVDEIQNFLTGAPASTEPDRVLATLLFTDIVGSTRRASEVGDQRWHQLLEVHNDQVRALLERFAGRELNTMGDGFFASFDGPGRAVECAGAIVSSLNSLGVTVRAGVHTGECERIGEKLGGLAVHVAARIAAMAEANEVLVSSTVRDLVVGSRLRFKDRGSHELRGVQGSWHLFAVAAEGPDSVTGALRLAGPREHMTRMDRGVVAIAKRMPWLLRLFGRLAGMNS